MQFTMEGRLIAFLLLASLVLAAPTPRSWIPDSKTLSSAVTDGDSQTNELLCKGAQSDPCDIGPEWDSARTTRQVILQLPRPLHSVSISGKDSRNFRGEDVTLSEAESLEIRATFL